MLVVCLQAAYSGTIQKSFFYLGKPQNMIFHQGCKYTVSLWGGNGGLGFYGDDEFHGGVGAYISAVVELKKTSNITIMVGGAGENGVVGSTKRPQGGWNGGGNAGRNADGNSPAGKYQSGAGGGSTDIRLLDPLNPGTLESRLLIASGGSGAAGGFYGAPGGNIDYHFYFKTASKIEITKASKNGGYGTNDILTGGVGEDYSSTPGSGGGGGEYGGKGGAKSIWGSGSNVGFSGSSGYFKGENDIVKKVTLLKSLTGDSVPFKIDTFKGQAQITYEDTDACLEEKPVPSEKPNPKPKRSKLFSIGIFTGITSKI